MGTISTFLSTFNDADVAWLVSQGSRVQVAAGETLAVERRLTGVLHLVLTGAFQASVNGRPICAIGPGEILGELSFLDGGRPAMTVTATSPSQVLPIDGKRLASRLERDDAFGARAYRSLAACVADRLRAANARASGGSRAPSAPAAVREDSAGAEAIFAEVLRRTGAGS